MYGIGKPPTAEPLSRRSSGERLWWVQVEREHGGLEGAPIDIDEMKSLAVAGANIVLPADAPYSIEEIRSLAPSVASAKTGSLTIKGAARFTADDLRAIVRMVGDGRVTIEP